MPPPAGDAGAALEGQIGRSLGWSFLNNAVGRIGSFLANVVVARIILPEDFGVFAVALVALNVMLSMNELGVSLAIVRTPGPVARIAPTVNTVALASSGVIFGLALLLAPAFTTALGAPEATGVVRLMAVGVLVDAATAVPVALMTRAFMQRRRLQIDLVAFLVSTPVTILLALDGLGAWGLAWGAVVGTLTSGLLSVLWAPETYRPGFDPAVARELLRFGLPLAGASLLLLVLVNVDYVVVGRMLGTTELGLYMLAFNLCSWPITLVSTAVRRVSMAAFARFNERGDGPEGFRQATALLVAVAVPLCALLAVYAEPLVVFVYGEKWRAAAAVIPALVVLSLGRMVVELTYDYLVAIGRTRANMWLHAVWLVALVPALVVGTGAWGIVGTAAGHAVVVVVVVVPLLGIVLHRAGVSVLGMVKDWLAPLAGAALVWGSSVLLLRALPEGFWLLAAGGVAGALLYVAIAGRPAWRTARSLFADGATR
ncbi:oligosaccharide flippase family protein [Georgenia sp.]